jgi:MFS family permease
LRSQRWGWQAWLAFPPAVIAGMCLFGAGFGILQNSTYVLMIDRVPPSAFGTASAIWNLAYDGGYGAGPALFGLVVGVSGYRAAFALTGLVMLVALPLARRERALVSAAIRRPAASVEPAEASELTRGTHCNILQ